jgi:WD40 repeat protein
MRWTSRFRRQGTLVLFVLFLAVLAGSFTQPVVTAEPPLQLGSSAFRHGNLSAEYEPWLAFSKDGTTILTLSSTEGSIRSWDVTTGRLLCEIVLRSEGSFIEFDVTPDGKWLATVEALPVGKNGWGSEYVIRLRDLDTGHLERSVECGPGRAWYLRSFRFSPDGKQIALREPNLTNDVETTVVRDIATGQEREHIPGWRSLRGSGFAPDGSRWAAVVEQEEVVLVRWEAGQPPTRIPTGLKCTSWTIHGSPDGSLFALVSTDDPWIELIDARSGKPIRRLRPPGGRSLLRHVLFTPDGKSLLGVEVGERGTTPPWDDTPRPGHVTVWNVASGAVVDRWATPGCTGRIVVSRDGKFVAMQAAGLPTWHLATGKLVRPLTEADLLNAQEVIGRASLLLTLNDDGPARLWEDHTGTFLYAFNHPDGPARAGAIAPDGKRIATAAANDSIRVWDARTGELQLQFPGHGKQSRYSGLALRFSPDGKTLHSFGSDYHVRSRDLASGHVIRESDVRMRGTPLEDQNLSEFLTTTHLEPWLPTFSADGSRLAYLVADMGKVHVFDVDTGRARTPLKLTSLPACAPVFTPDGRLLTFAQAEWEGIGGVFGGGHYNPDGPLLSCWDLDTGEILWAQFLPGRDCLAMAPDGRTFAMSRWKGRASGAVEFRSVDDGRLLGTVEGLPEQPTHLTYLPGQRLAMTLPDGRVQIQAVPRFKF